MMSALFRAYGLTIASQFPLAECAQAAGALAIDLTIAGGTLDGPMPPPPAERTVSLTGQSGYLAWSRLGRIRVENGSHVTVDLLPEFDIGALSLVLLGPVMAMVMHQRGHMMLHGSAVALTDDRAMLFLGDNGAGKSTLAAHCLKAGYPVLTDDVIAIGATQDRSHRLQPGFPAIKLSRAAAAALAPLPGALLPPVPPNAAKLRLRFDDFDDRPRPIARICLVRQGKPAEPMTLSPAEALAALMRYSYLPKFGTGILAGSGAARHFAQCSALAEQVPACLLPVPDALDRLPDFVTRLDDRFRRSAAE
jgi:hypothetical protein